VTIERLRAVHQARPFRPFVLHMADGKKIRVNHPEIMSVSPSGRTIIVNLADDSFHHIDLLMVVRIEVSNGTPRRKTKQ